MNLLSFDQYLSDSLKDPAFKKLWEKADPEYQLSRQIIKARLEAKMSQKDLAKKAHTTQAIISRLENSSFNPSLSFLKKIAIALNTPLHISLP
ncbi:MAG: Toxin-antitoxin system, antitoxin component, Xre family [Candidatus Collierbacteria bacterium GW2011_GWB1_45_35]|uniref:Toxin-antitoxin system, antitoxin component, Xre family n=2 Tax=Candidatus Collieribacteriota TaxID=1752725 RepID=A0A0G1NL95_9BACT|nr:MAG: Toxin-antitoxin system, antitoxin component, Xre family [Microgenomates group bacterium GW2011_GWC1_44_23]KKT84994.1 MAG: Toxin-antitoxin system, antitoxin component, Xre family [Candidatus Collierbacteria bacterium GW2011_GWA2_44_99]KKT96162.1 MAG: Toxin-antitoxin system, antitoxin component, Xre family [Candidatus Collierbacteria bacterium GW2011_GWA1_45_15]KKU01202.1 MAG: Toxin-antitoxin system, antitoxin component, Xre family [Candidatus Collierbacteria bacterium GW2011_GWB2_45_17]K